MFSALFKLVGWLVFFAALALLAVSPFVRTAQIGHNGMAPTLIAGDRVLIWKRAGVDLGDIVLCRNPASPEEFVLGRVVAKEGMHLETARSQLRVAGTWVPRDLGEPFRFYDATLDRTDDMLYGTETMGTRKYEFFQRSGTHFELKPRDVQTGLFLLNDNRSHPQQDSRSYGEVDPKSCVGRVVLRLVPADDQGNELGHRYLEPIR